MRHIYIASCDLSSGIYHYTFEGGELSFCEKTDIDRPMYAIIRDNKMYIILREIDTEMHFGGILSFDIDENGSLINLGATQSTNGVVPCHLEVLGNNRYVVNYLSGNIVKIGEKTVTHNGKGIHPTRQEASHTHYVCASPDRKYIFCTDLGLDTIFVYDTCLNEKFTAKVPDGSGCRHLCFNGDIVYCVNELSNDVSVFRFQNGQLLLLDTYAAIPEFTGQSTAAAIRISGDQLYVSHRGADCISCFDIKGEKLELLWNAPCGGSSPRDFDVVDGYILCANEGGNVSVLKIGKDGAALVSNDIKMPNPLCVTVL